MRRFRLLLALTCLICAVSIYAGPVATYASAAEPGVSLLRPDSLAGWDYGVPPRGWRIDKGTLHGTAESTPLLSGWTLGDFTLSLRWTVTGAAALILDLPDVPSGEGLQLRLAEGDQGVTLTDRGATALAGARIGPKPGGAHTATLTREGGKLTIAIDDQELGAASLDPKRRLGLGLEVPAGEVTISDVRLSEPAGDSIFNGRDLDGWWSPLGLKSWGVKNSAIECLNKDGNYLRTEKEFGNFTLSLEYTQAPKCNSGIGIRTARNGWPSGDGMELQLQDEPGLLKDSTMAIYGNLEPLGRADKANVWNTAVIKADGRMISGWINGELVQQTNTFWHPELKHRHLSGWIGFQDHGGKIELRNIRVLEAPAGLGLDAWYEPRTQSGPQIVFERLINPQRLSLADGITSGVVSRSLSSGVKQTVADLAGPGAVVQIWRSKPSGYISLYFDGQERPAIDCAANLLSAQVPRLAEESEPVLTCLPFAKSLRITLRDAPGVDYRIEYVKFPADMPVETFAPGQRVLPRGWTAAIDYRQHQYGWGTHREEDPAPRQSGEANKLEPGEAADLIQLEGAGIVQWLKLQADAQIVRNDDLWLEVRLDGQPQPAIAAPVRYFFPALTGAVPVLGTPANHYNFVNVYRNGFNNMLAMPFSRGLKVSVRNQGAKPLAHIGLVASVLRQQDAAPAAAGLDLDRRLRLRGRFDRASSTRELVAIEGDGRWVGLVWSPAQKSLGGIESLVVDGQKQAGWAVSSLDAFLGAWPGETNFFHVLSGRSGQLAWRYLLLAPVDFQKSLTITSIDPVGDRLVLWYER